MSTSLTRDQLERYRKRQVELGLDPDFDYGGHPYVLAVRGVEPLRKLWGATEQPSSKLSPLTAKAVLEAEPGVARQAVCNHVFGEKSLSSDAVEAADQRFPIMPVAVMSGPDITVTAQNPLIINNNSTITNYGKVTLQDGGYIDISVDCHFTCQVMEKIQGGNAQASHDITVHGKDGESPGTPATPPTPDAPPQSPSAKCDCCGGTVARKAKQGAKGKPGEDGTGGTDGGHGRSGPTTLIEIGSLVGSITLLNRGGNGGNGGNGGTGGTGGTGGKGGNGTTCGAYHPSGADGGKGGDGGNGGASATGGNGGDGGQTRIQYTPGNPNSVVIGRNEPGLGGAKGAPGGAGNGGDGGKGGSNGGVQGPPGLPGSPGSDLGRSGGDGRKGELIVNGQPVQ